MGVARGYNVGSLPSQHILFHHRIRGIDGQAIHVRAMHRAFLELGHRVSEVALVPLGTLEGEPRRQRAVRPWAWVTRLPRPLLELAEYAYTPVGRHVLLREGRREPADFIYARYSFADAAAVLASRRMGLPLVLEVNSPLAEELAVTRGLTLPRLARQIEKRVLRSAEIVCVVSHALGERLASRGVDPDRLLVTPNGVEAGRYSAAALERPATRARLGVSDETLVLGFVGYARAWHRLDWAIEALGEPGLEKTVLVLAGEGRAMSQLVARAGTLGVAERVRSLGVLPHDAVPAVLAGCDVGLLPGIPPYASPLKLPEYFAAGLAVVAPDQPNLREIVEPGSALLFPQDSYTEFLAALRRIVGDASLRRTLAEEGRAALARRGLQWTDNALRVVERVAALGSTNPARVSRQTASAEHAG